MDRSGYFRVRTDVEEQQHLSSDSESNGFPTRHSHYRLLWSTLLGILLGIISTLLATTTLGSALTRGRSCLEDTQQWSPALSIYSNDRMSLQRFDGALRHSNSYRGPPSDDIDAAWSQLIHPEGGLVRLSEDELQRVNASQYAAAFTEEMGGGYMAGVEVLHQLHCLNMIRKATYLEHYAPKEKEWEDETTLRYHLDHCIDMLRQKLMCNPDLGMVTYVWAKGWKQALPDFSTVHKCWDYSKVVDWTKEHSVHGRVVADLVRAPGALEQDARP